MIRFTNQTEVIQKYIEGEILELKTISNKIMIILIAIIVAIFAMGWILPIGIDKVTRLSYREYLFSTYTVFTQFGFLMFSFLVSFFINKEYSGKTILFYRMMNTNSLTFYIKSFDTYGRDPRQYSSSVIYRFLYFMDFSVILQMFLLSMISIQYILIVALISFYLLTFFYLSVLAYSIGLQQYFLLQLVDFTFLQYLMLQTNYI